MSVEQVWATALLVALAGLIISVSEFRKRRRSGESTRTAKVGIAVSVVALAAVAVSLPFLLLWTLSQGEWDSFGAPCCG